LYSETSSIDTQAINGMISAAAGTDNASGLYSVSKSITTGAINGTIRATAEQDRAFGFRSYESIYITGDIGIDANITATAGDDRAHGLYSENGSITTQAINGTISATAGNDRAYGLYSENGSITTGAIRGIIDANAGGDFAYGILSYDKMIVTVDGGTVSAVAHGGTNVAAIQSGRISSGGLSTQDAADTVEIVAGSTIVGDIDLAMDGTDNDELWLTGDTGTTTLDDDIWNVENIYITGGTWYFNGNVYNSNVELNGGVLSPGGSIGSMTIDGDLTIGSGGTYEVDVNNSEDHDYVGVTGTAYLGGTLRGNVYGGERIDHSFNVNVLDADTINGAFANVTGTTLFPIFDVGSGSVILQVIMDYAYYADTDNQHSVGEAFNDVVTEGLDDTDDDMNEVLTAIEGLDEATINGAYNQMMPQDALGQAEIIRNAMNQYSESVFGRMDNVRNGRQYAMSADSRYLLASMDNAMALPPKTDEWMPFAKGFGVWGDRNAESDIAGYQYNIYGMAGGVDKLVSDNTLIGISVAGSRANIDYSQAGTSSDIDSMFCSLYGSYFVDDWHVGLTLGYGHSWYDSQRSITFTDPDRRAESDHQGNSYSAAVELGKNLGDKSMILEPVAGIGYTAVQESGYTEKGADALNLKVDSTTADGIYGKLGVRVAKEFRPEQNPGMILVPNVSAFWVHDFADRVELSSSFVGGGSFTTQGLEPMRDTFNIGAGLNVYYNKNLRLFVDYGWQSASNFNSNTVQLGAQWSF
jgi:outer membrane autotransporter protein